MPEDKLTLYDIESALSELLVAREEVTDPDEIAAVEQAIGEYIARELSKVDGIRGYLRHAELMANAAREEAKAQAERARRWDARVARVKLATQLVMEQNGHKRLEGRTGSILLKGNGGLAPLEVNEAILPDEYRDKTIKLPVTIWRIMLEVFVSRFGKAAATEAITAHHAGPEAASNQRIREALDANQEVPGARLGERGAHIETH